MSETAKTDNTNKTDQDNKSSKKQKNDVVWEDKGWSTNPFKNIKKK